MEELRIELDKELIDKLDVIASAMKCTREEFIVFALSLFVFMHDHYPKQFRKLVKQITKVRKDK